MIAAHVLTRRAAVAALAASAGMGAARAEAPGARVASLDWGWASTLVALGIAPAGVAETRLYAAWVGAPALPATTVELGLRTTPSFETLLAQRPDLILVNSLNATLRPQLERIAPTLESPIFSASRTPLANARAAVRLLGDRLGVAAAAEAWLAESDWRFAAARRRLRAQQSASFIPIQFIDRRHLTIYGQGSLFGDVLTRLGLRSAYNGATTPWGSQLGDLAGLADLPPADLLLVAPNPSDSADILNGPSLFTSLVASGRRRLYRLPAAWAFGDLTAATRFAELIADALVGPQAGAIAHNPGNGDRA